MSQHTPGPWSTTKRPSLDWVGDSDEEVWSISVTAPYSGVGLLGGSALMEVCSVNIQNGAEVANAQLIAAAPDLLAALKAMVDIAPFSATEFDGVIHRQAEAAIAKAEGCQSSSGLNEGQAVLGFLAVLSVLGAGAALGYAAGQGWLPW